MKRSAVLLLVLVALVGIGVTMGPRSEPTAAATAQTSASAKTQQPEKPRSAAEKKAQQEKWFGAETVAAAQRAVRASLKDPDSAQFKQVYANYTEGYDVVACGQVNSKNSLGGYTGFKRFVSSGKSVILEGRDNVSEAWKKACQ